MAGVRPVAIADIPAVAQLFSRVYPEQRWPSPGECEAYFHQIFFANPWVTPQLPSWVATEGARAVGFIGVIPRPMRLRGRGLQAAVRDALPFLKPGGWLLFERARAYEDLRMVANAAGEVGVIASRKADPNSLEDSTSLLDHGISTRPACWR